MPRNTLHSMPFEICSVKTKSYSIKSMTYCNKTKKLCIRSKVSYTKFYLGRKYDFKCQNENKIMSWNIKKSTFLLCFCFACSVTVFLSLLQIISFFDLVRYCVSVCNQIACHLHIFVFKIKPCSVLSSAPHWGHAGHYWLCPFPLAALISFLPCVFHVEMQGMTWCKVCASANWMWGQIIYIKIRVLLSLFLFHQCRIEFVPVSSSAPVTIILLLTNSWLHRADISGEYRCYSVSSRRET